MPELSRPQVVLFDVNETLSDMTPMADRFAEVGAPAHLAATWFAALLRDGIALTAAGATAPMAEIGATLLRSQLAGQPLDRDLDVAVEHVMSGFTSLAVHADVVEGVVALSELGIRLATLSNGSADIARGLFERAGIADRFERLLSVDQAGTWKPAAGAYAYALAQCGVVAPDAMLVAVHPWDIDGAARAGLTTAWINRTGAAYPASFTPPSLQATGLTDLAAKLG
jgi:2-haloacid dehalogenase